MIAISPSEVLKMNHLLRRIELPLVLLLLLAGSAFLLKMCYLSLGLNVIFGLLLLGIFYLYIRLRHEFRMPPLLLLLVFAAIQTDALGNYFQMYGHDFGPMKYDEFAHLAVPTLVTPAIIWLVHATLEKLGYRLNPTVTSFFAATTIFSISALYEIIEFWDEVYFSGQRIWSKYDTANDLQWDLIGIVAGTLIANVMLKIRVPHDSANLKPLTS